MMLPWKGVRKSWGAFNYDISSNEISEWVALNLTLPIFMHYDFMRSMGWCKKDVTPFLTHLSCVFLALTHRNENTFCTRTFMCPWWLLEQPVGQTLEWPVSWDSIAYDSYTSVDLHACETVLKYFPGFSPEFNRNIFAEADTNIS